MAVAGSHAYVADGESGLRVINVADPATPVETGFYDTPGYARGVVVVGNLAYVADYVGLRVFNVADPAVPIEVGFYDTAGGAEDVALVGRYVHVADSDGGLAILRLASGEDRYVYLPLIRR